jgi:hypothetical protein
VGPTRYGLVGTLEQRVDQCLLLTSAAGWGPSTGLVPHGLHLEPSPSTSLLSAFFASAAVTGGVGLASGLGLSPRDTFVPQLLAGTGATLVALGVAGKGATWLPMLEGYAGVRGVGW